MDNQVIRRIGATAAAILLLIYVGYQFLASFKKGLDTETALYSSVSDTIDTMGFIVRNEKLIRVHANGVLNYTVDDGEKTASGGVIAEIYPTEDDAAARNRMERIEDELLRLAVLENPGEITTSNPQLIGSQISKKITSVLGDIKDGAWDRIDGEKNDLQLLLGQKQIITGAESAEEYLAHIESLRAEYKALERSAAASTGKIKSPASGYFIQNVDGYEEAVDLKTIDSLTTEDIDALLNGEASETTDRSVLGKVAMDFNWYIVCNIDENDLVRLDRTKKITVEMPFASVEKIPASIIKVNPNEETGGAALIIQCTYVNSDLIGARKEPLRININDYAGVLVNEKAIHFEDITVYETDAYGSEVPVVYENVRGVYVKSGSRLRFVQVFSDATINGYAICKISLSDSEKEQLVTEKTIQLYDEVVVGGTDLYDGKIL
ncbi:MAG: hypothetical protein IJF56_07875 [Clostridia bacterium]|nr:hypothetical protein [Clostridia bacterium]